MTAVAETEPVTGRSILRYRGPGVPHELRYAAPIMHLPGYRPGALYARCDGCGWHSVIDGGHSTADLVRLERQHAGLEDP